MELSACEFPVKSKFTIHIFVYFAVHRTECALTSPQNDNIKLYMNIHDDDMMFRLRLRRLRCQFRLKCIQLCVFLVAVVVVVVVDVDWRHHRHIKTLAYFVQWKMYFNTTYRWTRMVCPSNNSTHHCNAYNPFRVY